MQKETCTGERPCNMDHVENGQADITAFLTSPKPHNCGLNHSQWQQSSSKNIEQVKVSHMYVTIPREGAADGQLIYESFLLFLLERLFKKERCSSVRSGFLKVVRWPFNYRLCACVK